MSAIVRLYIVIKYSLTMGKSMTSMSARTNIKCTPLQGCTQISQIQKELPPLFDLQTFVIVRVFNFARINQPLYNVTTIQDNLGLHTYKYFLFSYTSKRPRTCGCSISFIMAISRSTCIKRKKYVINRDVHGHFHVCQVIIPSVITLAVGTRASTPCPAPINSWPGRSTDSPNYTVNPQVNIKHQQSKLCPGSNARRHLYYALCLLRQQVADILRSIYLVNS